MANSNFSVPLCTEIPFYNPRPAFQYISFIGTFQNLIEEDEEEGARLEQEAGIEEQARLEEEERLEEEARTFLPPPVQTNNRTELAIGNVEAQALAQNNVMTLNLESNAELRQPEITTGTHWSIVQRLLEIREVETQSLALQNEIIERFRRNDELEDIEAAARLYARYNTVNRQAEVTTTTVSISGQGTTPLLMLANAGRWDVGWDVVMVLLESNALDNLESPPLLPRGPR